MVLETELVCATPHVHTLCFQHVSLEDQLLRATWQYSRALEDHRHMHIAGVLGNCQVDKDIHCVVSLTLCSQY